MTSRTFLLSVDFEDWHQLVRRRVAAANWREPGPALARQTRTMLALRNDATKDPGPFRAIGVPYKAPK